MEMTKLCWSNDQLDGRLGEVQDLVRAGRQDDAVRMLVGMGKTGEIRRYLEIEAEFLRLVDASHEFGAAAGESGWTPRQAFIRVALFSGTDDCNAGEWSSPLSRSTLIACAQSIYKGPREHLEIAFEALVTQGLFFEVHPAVFAEPCYYCTFDVDFLAEFPNLDDLQPMFAFDEDEDPLDCREIWTELATALDEHFGVTWRKTGLCRGQGSQGPSDLPLSPCVGSCCCCYKNREKERCTHRLQFRLV